MFTPPQFAANPLRDRADVARLLNDLVEPLTPHFSAGGAQVHLGANRAHYGDPAGWLEGYARPLWGLAPLAAGGGDFAHWPLWQRGLRSGTDPDHSEYWGLAGDYDQRSVEQAAFGFSLALNPERFWEPLDAATRRNLAAWLRRINEVQVVRSNWLYFRILVNLGLKSCGQPWSPEQTEADFALLETFHQGGGWYSDGVAAGHHRDGRTGDYYVPMAFQLYSLIYAKLAADHDAARCAGLRERARAFAQDFQHYFAADGSALPFGRSLTYRFSQGAFWGALAFADVEALPWPVIKGLYLRHLRWWMRQPIFTETGLLTIGYTYPNLLTAESYNSPGSPYWALKAFLPLALPDDHPFWRADEAPLPARRSIRTIPGANLVLATDAAGDVTAINPGQPVLDWPRNAPHKYSKFTYSTRFGFALPLGAAIPAEGGLDGELSLSDDGRFYRRRDFCEDAAVADGVACSRWSPWPGVELRTWLLAEVGGHLRVHRLGTGRPLRSLEAGFATVWFSRRELANDPSAPRVSTPRDTSIVTNLLGDRTPTCIDLGASSHLLASLSSMPALQGEHAPGVHWLCAWVSAGPAGASTENRFTATVSADTCELLRDGRPWWRSDASPCGASAPDRLAALETHLAPGAPSS